MDEINWRSRWSNDQIRTLLVDQYGSFWKMPTGIQREKLTEVIRNIEMPHAVIISGLRRVGKSTLLTQLGYKLPKDSFYYLNFEDERFIHFRAEDMNDLFQFLVELFGDRKIFILDEIQNIPGWEHFVRRFMDQGYKFFITGSNASLLSRELGTRLTGRHISIELFPFSFSEYLQFVGNNPPDFRKISTVEKAEVNSALQDYLFSGGIPEALKYPELPLLQSLYDDILYRDIAARHKLEAIYSLRDLAFFLISNPSSLVAYNKLKERLHLGSVNTVHSYIEYMKDSWLLFPVNVYSDSIKRQQLAPKKIYFIDTGLVNSVGFNFSPNTGKLLENLVYINLRRQFNEVYYYKTPGGKEVDFYIPENRILIQVASNLENEDTRLREVRALIDAMSEMPGTKAVIFTDSNQNDIVIENHKIKVLSTAEWLIHPDL
jgi:uncharacterized protein